MPVACVQGTASPGVGEAAPMGDESRPARSDLALTKPLQQREAGVVLSAFTRASNGAGAPRPTRRLTGSMRVGASRCPLLLRLTVSHGHQVSLPIEALLLPMPFGLRPGVPHPAWLAVEARGP